MGRLLNIMTLLLAAQAFMLYWRGDFGWAVLHFVAVVVLCVLNDEDNR